MQLGRYNNLIINRFTDFGAYLTDQEDNDVLLPAKWLPREVKAGDEISVFVYKDAEERLIATTLKPAAQVGEFAVLRVKQLSKIGAFLDWGLEKDLFIPFQEQPEKLAEEDEIAVFIYVDNPSKRITASAKLQRFFSTEAEALEVHQEVEILVYHKTALGFLVVINNRFRGMIYYDEIFKPVKIGQRMQAYVKQVREDGKVDLLLQKPGVANLEPMAEKILSKLQQSQGFLPLNDKSAPEEISRRLQMSKKTFKKAVGGLYKQKLIELSDKGIRLRKN